MDAVQVGGSLGKAWAQIVLFCKIKLLALLPLGALSQVGWARECLSTVLLKNSDWVRACRRCWRAGRSRGQQTLQGTPHCTG